MVDNFIDGAFVTFMAGACLIILAKAGQMVYEKATEKPEEVCVLLIFLALVVIGGIVSAARGRRWE